jgi:hypothetical protein
MSLRRCMQEALQTMRWQNNHRQPGASSVSWMPLLHVMYCYVRRHLYNRQAIQEWLRKHDTSPMSGQPLASKALSPAPRPLRAAIKEHQQRMGLGAAGGSARAMMLPPDPTPPSAQSNVPRAGMGGSTITRSPEQPRPPRPQAAMSEWALRLSGQTRLVWDNKGLGDCEPCCGCGDTGWGLHAPSAGPAL